jgi:hypothetical protein
VKHVYDSQRTVVEVLMPMASVVMADQEEIMLEPRLEKGQRRRFTAEQKGRILHEADACTERGSHSSSLSREGRHE